MEHSKLKKKISKNKVRKDKKIKLKFDICQHQNDEKQRKKGRKKIKKNAKMQKMQKKLNIFLPSFCSSSWLSALIFLFPFMSSLILLLLLMMMMMKYSF